MRIVQEIGAQVGQLREHFHENRGVTGGGQKEARGGRREKHLQKTPGSGH